jgi:hypothetical protein
VSTPPKPKAFWKRAALLIGGALLGLLLLLVVWLLDLAGGDD